MSNGFEKLADGSVISAEEMRSLSLQILADPDRAAAFGITPETVDAIVQQRLELLQSLASHSIQQRFQQADGLRTLWEVWLPLAMNLHQHQRSLGRPLMLGILGGQGTGKTTLAVVLSEILAELGCRSLSFSLDDLYKPYADRQQLCQHDPRLIWRGVPGTHDVELGVDVLDKLRRSQAEIAIPRFDKSLHNGAGDRIAPKIVSNIDIVLFEGWFVGVQPVHPDVFETAPDPIVTEADRAFARDMNAALNDYLPLWKFDQLLVLSPIDYRLSKQWRKQAEQEMKASGKPGMSDEEIDRFVDYFWKALHPELFIQPIVTNPTAATLVIEIDANHCPSNVYRGGDRVKPNGMN